MVIASGHEMHPLAYRALQAEDQIGLLLPCNVVVRSLLDGRTEVAAIDPQVLITMTGNPALAAVADDASSRLSAALRDLLPTT